MAQRSIARMYDSYETATTVVGNLEQAGIPHSDISLVANADAHGRYTSGAGTAPLGSVDPASHADTDAGAGAGRGAVVGTVLGGGVGLLAGIGALAIPGVGPVVAAGWLIATLTGAGIGAASGGLVGSLTGAGISHDEAHVYSEGVKRGSSLVTVRVDEADAARVEAILSQSGAVDWQERRASYGPGWTGSDEAAVTSISPVAPADEAIGAATPTLPHDRI
jgi:hypothetical protein